MTQAELSTGTLIARSLLRWTLIVGGVLAVIAAIGLIGGGRLPTVAFHPHAPRFDLLAQAGPLIEFHVAAALTALVVGLVILAGVKGTALHKAMGWTWVAAMASVAISSLFIKVINPGHWSFIHFLSGWVIIALPMGVAAIRRRNVRMHRRMMTGLFVGGLIVAGAFTFVPGRLMWAVFFG